MSETNAIGIDLGTCSSRVGVVRDGKIVNIVNESGNRSTPSSVAFTNDGLLVGETAENLMDQNCTNIVFAAKRLLGCKFTDRVVQANMRHWPFRVIEGEGGKPLVQVESKGETKTFTPEEISAMVLTKMKQTAEAFLGGHPVKNAVISVPANFNDAQRQATKDSGAIAGLNVLRIMNDSSLAAHAYGLDKKGEGERTVLVFDFGGGTLDVSVIVVNEGVIDVKSVAGSTQLGGEDFTSRMVHHFAAEFNMDHERDIASDKAAVYRLRSACERAKRTLSTSSQVTLEVDSLFDGIDFCSKITREKFEEICEDLFKEVEKAVRTALRDAKMAQSNVNEVVLIGGSSNMPKVETILSEVLPETHINKSTKDSGAIAGLNAIRISNKSSLAAHAYGLEKKDEEERNAVVVDLGDRTLEVSVIGVKKGVIDVKYVAGSTQLGGEDFTNRMVDHFAAKFKDISLDNAALVKLRSACERAKKTLSTFSEVTLKIDSLFDGNNFFDKITREKFEEICEELFNEVEKTVETSLSDAKMDKSDVNDIVLVGGASNMPKVTTMLSDVLPEKPIIKSIDPIDHKSTVFGATVQAAVLSGDTCEAVGGGKVVRVHDVVPNSLGIEDNGKFMSTIIPRNTQVPTETSIYASTVVNLQTSCAIKVFEGEAELTKDNNLLGEFMLTNIEEAPKGEPLIEVTYKVDAEGILQVSAKDLKTGSQGEITITSNKGRLSKEEIKQMTAAMADTTI